MYRYNHLNCIVDEITKDDLINSSNSLNFSFKSLSSHNQIQNGQQILQNRNNSKLQKINSPDTQNPLYSDAANNTLVYPPSNSHQFSTLTLEQHDYLLQQQRMLMLSINSNFYPPGLQSQQQHHFSNHHHYIYPQYMDPYQQPLSQNIQLNSYTNQHAFRPYQNLAQSLSYSPSSTLSSPTSPQANPNKPTQFQVYNTSQNNSSINRPPLFFYPDHFQMQLNQQNLIEHKMLTEYNNNLIQMNLAKTRLTFFFKVNFQLL